MFGLHGGISIQLLSVAVVLDWPLFIGYTDMTRKRCSCVPGLMVALLLAGLITPAFLLPKTKVTRENFVKLKVGMTQAEASELFGEEPEEWLCVGSDFGLLHKLWEGEGIAIIRFERNGGLHTKCWSEQGFESATKQSFDRVEVRSKVTVVKWH